MSVQNQTVKNIYEGNGSATVFPFTFALNPTDGEHVGVYVTNDRGISEATANFTIDVEAKTVTYPKEGAPLEAGRKITIRREIPNEQELNLENLGPFFAEDIEGEMDREVMMIQQLVENVDRALKVDISNDTAPNVNEILNSIDDSVAAAAESEKNAANSAAAAAESEKNAANSAAAAAESEKNAADSAADAINSKGEPYDPNKTYNFPNLVIMPDGSAWRCLETSTGEYPPTSSKWTAETLTQGETFEYDDNGDLQPREFAQTSSMWQINEEGNIMPMEIIRVWEPNEEGNIMPVKEFRGGFKA